MMLRSFTAASALLAGGCFVDNRPHEASASVASTGSSGVDPGSSGNPTTGGATSLPATSDGTGDPTTTTGGITGDVATTTTTTTDPATTAPVTSEPPGQCSSLATLGGVASVPACAACVSEHCCEPFDTCASTDKCAAAWSCISDEPCQNKWPACPGAIESFLTLNAISDCITGPCAEVCVMPCAAQTQACAAEPECVNLEACVAACADMCDPDKPDCPVICADDCAAQYTAGLMLYQAKLGCLNTMC